MAIPNFPDLEREILQSWKREGIFGQTLRKPAPRGRFVFYDGPPTANGQPHIGHVETRAFKDVIPRFKTMQGFSVERKAGWDTQGLPVEIEVEKSLGISGKKQIEAYGVEKFNQKARESVWKYKELWEQMTERIGFWLDLSHPYITYSNEYIESLWWIFRQAWDAGLLERDFKVIHYCPRCGTALSSHEVAQGYQRVSEPAVTVKFELVDEPGTFVLAWTTTPWTLPGNVALAVDPDMEYVYVEDPRGESYVLAHELLEKISPGATIKKVVHGRELIGKKYRPLFDFLDLERESGKKAYYILGADFVTTEDGTGVVHTAVMYGEDDFRLGKAADLPTIHTVDEQGRFTALVHPWAGREVRDPDGQTQRAIIEWLRERGQLYREESYEHDYPFCWRCKHPLLYYAKTSWFIRMSSLRGDLLAANEAVGWHPGHIKHGRFGEWLRDVKDWAISRERYWGTPLPIWSCDSCQHEECVGSYESLLKHLPTRNRYIFVRHGESQNNADGMISCRLETNEKYPLTEAGRRQATELAEKLRPVRPAAVYSSPFLRTRLTADAIAQAAGLKTLIDSRLSEFQCGYDERPHAEYHEFCRTINRFHQAPPRAETWLALRARLFQFLHEIDQHHDGQTIVIVTHADPILVTEWAAALQSETQLVPHDWVEQGGWREIRLPLQVYQPDGAFDPHRPFIDRITWPCPVCRTGAMKRTPEVADTWFDSGAMPFAQWHYPFEHREKIDDGVAIPADYISEAIDQTRGWFYTLLAIATILKQRGVVKGAPYRNVVVLGHVNDAEGRKLSKSLGNYVDPMEVIEAYGADAVRWFMFTINQPWDAKNFDRKGIEEGVRKTFLIWLNVVTFWKTFPQDSTADYRAAKHPLDLWILSRINALVREMTDNLERYDITTAARQLGEFVADLSTWYVRRSRDRFKNAEGPLASAVLREVLLRTAALFAPFTPFLAEYVYQQVGGEKPSVHLEDWPTVGLIDEKLMSDMRTARGVVEEFLALRAQAGLKIRQPLQQAVTTRSLRPDLDDVVRDELNVMELHVKESLPSGNDWIVGPTTALDTSISDELREAGQYRELVREVNALRKTANLVPSDLIVFYCQPNTYVAKLIEIHAQEFLRDVRARAVQPNLEGAAHRRIISIEGEAQIGLSKV